MAAEKAGARVSIINVLADCRHAHNSWLRCIYLLQSVVVPSDNAFVTSVASYVRKCATGTADKSHMYIETAGGES